MQTFVIIDENLKTYCDNIKKIIVRNKNIPRDNILCVGVDTDDPRRKPEIMNRHSVALKRFSVYKEKWERDYINAYIEGVKSCGLKNKTKQDFKKCINDMSEGGYLEELVGRGVNPLQKGVSDNTIRKFSEILGKYNPATNTCSARVVIISEDRGRELESSEPCVDRLAIKKTNDPLLLKDYVAKKLELFLS